MPQKPKTTIPRDERLIVALDVPTAGEAKAMVEKLGDAARFYKVGLELFSAAGYFELIEWLTGRGHRVFADLKLYDIPETVGRAVANLRSCGASFVTVHGHRSVMAAAAREKGAMKILAVTVLTSFEQRDLDGMGATKTIEPLVPGPPPRPPQSPSHPLTPPPLLPPHPKALSPSPL